MIKKLFKKIIYSNGVTTYLFQNIYLKRASYKAYWILWNIPFFQLKKIFRLMGICSNDYKKLKQYKDCHKGERCFIIATGPSLTIEDLNKLKDEITFGMNSLCKIFDKTGWETTYYVVQDYGAFNLLKDALRKLKTTTFFYGDQWFKKRDIEVLNCKTQKFPRYYEHHGYDQKNLKTHFSTNAYKQVYEAYTVAVCTMQLAAYMGFSELYLIGTDCNYNQKDVKNRYFMGMSYGYDSPQYKTLGNKMLYAYSVAKEALDKKNVRVYNASRGGMLEVFPRVNLDEILQKGDFR